MGKGKIKLPFWATTLTILGVFILCNLGTWQLHRLSWKNDLLAKIEAGYARKPTPTLNVAADFKPFTYGKVFGHYLHDREIALGPRTHKGTPGYHILTPLVLPGKATILVNRGWVPQELKALKSRPKSRVLGYVDVTGFVRETERPNPFTPENSLEQNSWYYVNINQIAKAKNLNNLVPYILYAEQETNPSNAKYPLAMATKWSPNNNHLQYALFWFFLAVTLCVMYYLRFLRKV